MPKSKWTVPIQADTRMKALAITSNRMLTKAGGWELIDVEPKQIETGV